MQNITVTNNNLSKSTIEESFKGPKQSTKPIFSHSQTNGKTAPPTIVNVSDLTNVKIPIPKIVKPPPPKPVSANTNSTQPLVLTSQQFATVNIRVWRVDMHKNDS